MPGTEPLADDPRPDGLRNADSLVLVLTGDGKGKSSSAFGMVMRGRGALIGGARVVTGRSARLFFE